MDFVPSALNLPDLPNALCKDTENPDLFFGQHVCDDTCDRLGCQGKSETGRAKRIDAAKAMCGKCVERIECANWAIDNKVPYGIWGGLNERERTMLRLNRKRATTYE